uniref:Uncharacterized protein n=1 Tax=Tetranychus urticae TaxID=32264 RepID=T1KVD3_TETUR
MSPNSTMDKLAKWFSKANEKPDYDIFVCEDSPKEPVDIIKFLFEAVDFPKAKELLAVVGVDDVDVEEKLLVRVIVLEVSESEANGFTIIRGGAMLFSFSCACEAFEANLSS